ncbi:hypothetical protein ACH5RR_004649 [Cinchona calisaya]|uniref:Uncharacterized protein n=1 Tax=Cinchona calisaya TaxID=153742 RepID=A0ABD3AYJ6_9GENT
MHQREQIQLSHSLNSSSLLKISKSLYLLSTSCRDQLQRRPFAFCTTRANYENQTKKNQILNYHRKKKNTRDSWKLVAMKKGGTKSPNAIKSGPKKDNGLFRKTFLEQRKQFVSISVQVTIFSNHVDTYIWSSCTNN